VVFLDNGQRALVTLRPSWLARLFGARESFIELKKNEMSVDLSKVWRSQHTSRPLYEMAYGKMILAALEQQPAPRAPALPAAVVVTKES
jgi:hypothetical protein